MDLTKNGHFKMVSDEIRFGPSPPSPQDLKIKELHAENERLKDMVEALEAEVKLLRKIRADELEAEEN